MKIFNVTKLFIAAILLLSAFGCVDKNKEEITTTVDSFFKNYKGDFRTANKDLLSKNFIDLINKTIEKEDAEAEKVKSSEFPTDKPLMIEGDIFCSLFEGQDSCKIGEITVSKDTATVSVDFSNSTYAEHWKDKIILIKESGWKIDNVIYSGHKIEVQSAKEGLNNFLLYGEE